VGRDERGFLVANDACETGVAGIWAIGAVRSGYSGLLIDAALEARKVAERIARHLGHD